MAVEIVGIRLSGGSTLQHIVHVWWENPTNNADKGDCSRARMVSWIENEGGKAYVQDSNRNRADVLVVDPAWGEKYLRTRADGIHTDNLLALPRR